MLERKLALNTMKDWMKRMPLAGTRCMLYRQRDLQDLVVGYVGLIIKKEIQDEDES